MRRIYNSIYRGPFDRLRGHNIIGGVPEPVEGPKKRNIP